MTRLIIIIRQCSIRSRVSDISTATATAADGRRVACDRKKQKIRLFRKKSSLRNSYQHVRSVQGRVVVGDREFARPSCC